MATISLTLPTAGTVVTAGLHATNATAIQGVINGGLDTANWSSGKIFAPSKLMQEAATDKQVLAWNNGSALWVPTSLQVANLDKVVPYVYDRATTTVDVQNSAAETSIYSKSIAGNDMGTNRMLRLSCSGDYLHNNAVGDTIVVKIKFGGTTLFASNAYNLGNVTGAGRQPWELRIALPNLGAANSQALIGSLVATGPNVAAPTTGIGFFGPAVYPVMVAGISTLAAIDTTTAQTLDITVQWSAASANNSWRTRYSLLELV